MKRITDMMFSKEGPLATYIISMFLAVAFCLTCLATPESLAQPAQIPSHQQAFSLHSDVHDGLMEDFLMAFKDVVRAPDAPWLRLHFSEYNLGMHSYITITSLKDGAQQRLDARSLGQWRGGTAFFNGDAAEVELNVAPGDRGVFFHIDGITVGEHADQGSGSKDICGDDDRIASTNPRCGRIIGATGLCSGFIVSNGAHLSAGHCNTNLIILQFNVPPSLPNGTIQHPGPNDQYSIDPASIAFHDDTGEGNELGNDWAVFACFPNANTGLLPVHAQGAFYRMSRDDDPSDVRVTGYGSDPGTSGNYAQQTDSGSYLGQTYWDASDVGIEYIVDTESGSSGSPVIILGALRTLGIHEAGGCFPPLFGNWGTGFENNHLENAIAAFPGPNAVYVDQIHPITPKDGTVLRPFATVSAGVNGVTSGGIVSIVAGSYTETVIAGADGKAMRLEAPVGTVIIGATKSLPTSSRFDKDSSFTARQSDEGTN